MLSFSRPLRQKQKPLEMLCGLGSWLEQQQGD